MKRLYEKPAYDTGQAVGSFWEDTIAPPMDFPVLEGDKDADVAIIGGGYTGLNAALQLAETHGVLPILLDAARPAWGASGRNGGFACLGGAKLSTQAQIKRFGLAETKRFFAAQLAAIDCVKDNLERYAIDADTHSGEGELCLAHRHNSFKVLQQEAVFNEKTFGIEHEVFRQEQLPERGLNASGFHGAVLTKAGFALNPLKYAIGLAHALAGLGARVHANSPVTEIRAEASRFRLVTPTGSVRTKKVIIATNGYSSDDLPDALGPRYLPVISSVLVTRPIRAEELAAQGWTSDLMSYDSRHLLHYFRLMPDRRFLFGQRGAISANAAATKANRHQNRQDFEAMFPGLKGVETSHHWTGLLCTTMSRHPYIGSLGDKPGLLAALGYHGNGVAMASHAGRLVGDLAAGAFVDLPDALATPLARFPLPDHRRHFLRAAYLHYRLMDAI
ncbi:MAG: FAD-binding oxidoreductase [Rhodobacteraceae bacterium]|nr:FAD-binding oxidoreductase [Paracoccaceae bacterium]